MSNLEVYINELKEYFSKHPDFTETEKIMYVYLDLGKKLKFDQDFYFGGSKTRRRIYEHSSYDDYVEESFDRGIIICKSSARICQHIFSELGIDCLNEIQEDKDKKYEHIYNIIVPKDGSERYSIDLQDDIENIKFHASMKCFGLSLDNPENYVISKNEQKRIHEKIGYISKKNPYMDDYIYLFKQFLNDIPDFNQKIDLLLQNIDPEKREGIDYWERRWKHEKFIEEVLPKSEIQKKLHTLEVYKKNKNKKDFYNTYYVFEKGKTIIYMYSEKDYKYNKIPIEDFAKMVKYDGFTPIQGVPGLKGELRKLDNLEKAKDLENSKEEH